MTEKGDKINEERFLNEEFETEELSKDIGAILADLESTQNISVKVYKASNGYHGKQEYLFETSPAAFSLDGLRDTYGAGTYRVHVREGNKIRANSEILIGAPIKRQENNVPDMNNILNQVKSENQNMMMQFMQMQMGMMEKFFTATNSRQGSSLGELAEVIAILKPEQKAVESNVDLFFKGIEFYKEMAGEKTSDENPIMGVLASLAPTVLAALNTQPRAPQQVVPVKPAIISHVEKPNQETQQVTEEEKMTLIERAAVKNYLSMLCAKAKTDSSVELYAEFIVDNIPPERIVAIFGVENPIEELSKIQPDCANYKEWFEKLIEEIKKYFVEDEAAQVPE